MANEQQYGYAALRDSFVADTRISDGAFRLATILRAYSESNTTPTLTELAELRGKSEAAVTSEINELLEHGIIGAG